jgi:hypothetical protein
VILQALNKDPSYRPQSIEAFKQAWLGAESNDSDLRMGLVSRQKQQPKLISLTAWIAFILMGVMLIAWMGLHLSIR